MSSAKEFILGFDSEWVDRGGVNEILSYQWHLITPGGSANGIFLKADFEGKDRMPIRRFLARVLEEGKNKGLFSHYPKSLTLVAHFSLADLNAFDDFYEAVRKAFDSVRKTYVSLGDPVKYSIVDRNNHSRSLKVTLRDSMLIAPAGSRLSDIGVLHGIPKIDLPKGMIEQMDVLLEKDPVLFKQYAIRDAEVTAVHAQAMAGKSEELTGNREIPISLGSLAVSYCQRCWVKSGIESMDVLGQEVVVTQTWDKRLRRYRTTEEVVPVAAVHENEAFVTECYHGGRNESFMFGASTVDRWRDIDLVGAYSTAMATMGMLDWDKTKETTDLDEFTAETVGFARVKFEHPSDTRYPGLPVRLPSNLIFPLRGESYATAPEIAVARDMGCKIEILKGRVIPVKAEVKPVFDVVKRATDGRKEAKARGDVLEDKLYKELINSFYGKFAQGLRPKRIFSTSTGETEDLGPSRVTQAFIAAHVTGLVRAVLAEIMNRIPSEYLVVSVTTDGFITNAPEQVTDGITDGPICQILKRSRTELVGDDTILEDKHMVRQVLSWRTRGQATLKRVSGDASDKDKTILAKAGLKAPYGLDNLQQNEWITKTFLDREWDSRFVYERLRGLREIYEKDGDLVSEQHTQRLNMDFDFKCRIDPHSIRTRKVAGVDHVFFTTTPWRDIVDYLNCQEIRNGFLAGEKRCLKTRADVKHYQELVEARQNLPEGTQHDHESGGLGDALRFVVRAIVHGQWSLSKDGLTYSQWKDWFVGHGYQVTVDMFKKAKSRDEQAPDHSVELTGETFGLMGVLKSRFPDFDYNSMFTAIAQKDRESEVN